MAAAGGKLRFALDHNFPAPVLKAFGVMMPNVELVPIAEIDDALLALPKEMTVLSQTNLTLVVAAGEGHNPIRAVGLLLCHLNHICHHTKPDRAQVWRLSVSQKDYDEPRKYLEKIAEKRNVAVDEIVQTHKLSPKELRRAWG